MHPLVISPQLESWEICVITKGEIGFANLEGASRVYEQMAPGLLYDAGNLLDSISDTFHNRAEGVLLVDRFPGPSDEEEGAKARTIAMEASAVKAGWVSTSVNSEDTRVTGWLSFRNADAGRVIHVGILPAMEPGRMALYKASDPAQTIIDKMIEYGTTTGVLWRINGGISCCLGIRADREERSGVQSSLVELGIDMDKGEPWWRWDSAPSGLHGAGRPTWSRDLAPAERHGHVVTFDVRAQGLAAMYTARFGWGRPRRKGNATFDPTRAGLWLIAGRALTGMDGPPLLDERYVDSRGLTWVSTRALEHYFRLGIEPLIYDSWTTATSAQLLKPFAQKLRNALLTETCTIREAIKATYSEGPSMWTRPGGSIFRPDWYHTHQDTATFNLRLKIEKAKQEIGMWPCRIYGDEISYPVDDEQGHRELAAALGVELGKPATLGKLKYTGRELASDWQDKRERNTKARV